MSPLMSKERRPFVGETDVWVGVGHAWKDVPGTKAGGRGRSAPTYTFRNRYIFDLRRHYPEAKASYACQT